MISLSILLSTRQSLTFSAHAYLMTVCVYGDTPSLTSTITRPPSDIRSALLTSFEKSTCPGESMRLTRCYCSSVQMLSPFLCLTLRAYKSDMDEAFMVIILCCSSSRESRYRNWPASLWLMIWLELMSESLNVVLPWSTCAKIQIFLTRSGYCCSSSTLSSQVRPFFASCGGFSSAYCACSTFRSLL